MFLYPLFNRLLYLTNNILRNFMRKIYSANLKRIKALPKIVAVFLFIWMFGCATDSFAQGPGAAWGFVRSITLNTPTTLANYQVKVTLTIAIMGNPYTNVNATGSDLRFYDNTNTNCPYWIESFNNAGTSIIWVKVVTAGSPLTMYYGNAAAPAVTSGTTTFDFFDDFTSALGVNWSQTTSGGTVTQAGTNVTLSNTNAGTVGISSAFAPASTSFFLETKHQEAKYFRNRFYAATALNGGNPLGPTIPDYGYFVNNIAGAYNNANIYYNGFAAAAVTKNTDYLTRWQLTDGGAYNWSTLNYATGAVIDTRAASLATNVRAITIQVTEAAATSTIVDWVRVRKSQATDPTTTVGAQVVNAPALTSLGSASGCAGSSITINGTNLSGATAANVQVGGTPVSSITSNSGTQIIAVLGSGTTGFVTVTTAGGTASSSPTSFTV
ncbi:MAG: DUF2341 domain-containing protein, partial [Taibaiella sp.]|nr:DUF2341 domain-containing protein [Taibaiella sp.]